jgi:DNA/RNA-binding domain of Phe-tRNA-synthetase-like protein
MPPRLRVDAHPLLAVAAFSARLPRPIADLHAAPPITALLDPSARSPIPADEGRRERVRAMLRHGGYKPSGRGKPASEYLVRAAAEGQLGSINPAVDACNAVSLHAGFPISVVDLDRTEGELSVRLGRAGESYVFNASGQTIDVAGLIVLCDAQGPTANAVKDAQRTKTGAGTTHTLSILWGTAADRAALDAAASWYRELLQSHLGAVCEVVEVTA